MNTIPVDTLLLARWLIPVEPHHIYYENYAVAIKDGRIVDILSNDEAQKKYQAHETIHLLEHAILPGLINAHTHSPMALLRGLADDLTLMDWLQNHIWPAEKAWLSEDFIKDGMELAIAEMIRCGTTGFNEHYLYYGAAAEITAKTGMRANIGIFIMDLLSIANNRIEDLVRDGLPFIEKYNDHPLIQVSLAPHGPYSVGDDSLRQLKEISDKYNLPIHMHVQETAVEVQEAMAKTNKRPLQRLYDLGLLSSQFQAVHMTQVNDEDLAILQATSTSVVHCPESNLKLTSGFCPVSRLIRSGINVALGTDGAASNNDLDMLGEMRTAALIGKLVAEDSTAVSAPEALRMATLNGAIALGWQKETGSLEIGKSADIIAINLNELNTQPVYNPISQIVYAASAHQITDVWVKGRALMRSRELKTLNEKSILEKAKLWQERIRSSK